MVGFFIFYFFFKKKRKKINFNFWLGVLEEDFGRVGNKRRKESVLVMGRKKFR